jgi:myo-inositol-1(or 4)-monophosphatase
VVPRGDGGPHGSPVTAADREAEAVLVSGLAAAFPADAVSAEEGARRPGGPGRWFVDPLDGTSAFVEGLAHWGPSLGRIEGARITHGATWFPRTRDHWYVAGDRAWRDGRPLPRLAEEAGRPRRPLFVPSRVHAWLRLDWPAKVRCLGSTAAHLALVASGGAEAVFVGAGWQPWDTAAGLALIRAVGGRTAQLDGRPLDFAADVGTPFVAGSARAVDWLTRPGRIAPLDFRGTDG